MYIISAMVFEINLNSIAKNSWLDQFGLFSRCEYMQGKVHYMLTSVSLQAVIIFLNQGPKILKPMWKWFSTERSFIRWKNFQTNRPFQILSFRDKYDSEVKVRNNPEYSTKIYWNRKGLSSFILNGENILSSARKTTFYPKHKNHAELTERRMKTMNQKIYSKLMGLSNI